MPDASLFRGVMRRWASGVTVATFKAAGQVRGITMSSFTSVSLDPMLILVSIDKRAHCHRMALESGRYCVHVLGEGQQHLSDRYAGRRGEEEHSKFDDVSSRATPTGEPILDGVLGWFYCRIVNVVDGGDHTLFVGEVEDGEVGEDAAPLVFFGARYRRLAPVDPFESSEVISAERAFQESSL